MKNKWILKAILQGIISNLPGSRRINYLFQTKITRNLTVSNEKLFARIKWAQRHFSHYQRFSGFPKENPIVLEIGTGWFPTVPIVLSLCGCERIYTVDIHDLIIDGYFRAMLEKFASISIEELRQAAPCIEHDRFLKFQEIETQSKHLSIDEILDKIRVTRIIGDASQLAFPENYVDLIISNTTLEHIPPEVLKKLFQEFYRVSHSNTISSHLIDMNDHYAFFDKSITVYNFLRFSKKQWRWFNNAIHYQNRLRLSEYSKIATNAGFTIIDEDVNRQNAHLISEVPIHKDFAKLEHNDIVAHSVWQVSVANKQQAEML